MTTKLSIFLRQFDSGEYGYDISITDQTATLADFLMGLDNFAAAHLAACRGCDGCCHERAPLTSLDIPLLAALLPPSCYPAHSVLDAFGTLHVSKKNVADITMRRNKNGSCFILDIEGKFCTIHHARPFVCRSHFCLPKSEVLQEIRAATANAGENEFIRLLIAEEKLGAPVVLPPQIKEKDYPPNVLTGKMGFNEVLICDLMSAT